LRGTQSRCRFSAQSLSSALGSDGDGIVLKVQVEEELRPAWLEGTYDDWIEVWDAG
jgi:hypothetical protein